MFKKAFIIRKFMTETPQGGPMGGELAYNVPDKPEIYRPKVTIPVASSFEGVVNDGAPECGLVSWNAYPNFFGHRYETDAFGYLRAQEAFKAFLKLRPLVEVASDYMAILKMINKYERQARELAKHGAPQEAYRFFINNFVDTAVEIGAEQLAGFDRRFYAERKRLQNFDYDAWLGLQSLMPGSMEQFRLLHDTAEYESPESVRVTRGFVPWFATAKDEESTHALCLFYSTSGALKPQDVTGERCVMPRKRIIGKERTRVKNEQLKRIAEEEDVRREQVFYVNDRFDREHAELREAGFPHQFIVTGGYAFPWEYDEAQQAGIVVVKREELAYSLGEYAKEKGF